MTLREQARAVQLLTKWRKKFDELAAARKARDVFRMFDLLEELAEVQKETAAFVDHEEGNEA